MQMTYNNKKIAEKKNYLQFSLTDLRDVLDPAEYQEMWDELIGHHCFRGNDSMMVLERFYFSKEYFDDLKQLKRSSFMVKPKNFVKSSLYSNYLVGFYVVREILKKKYKLCKDPNKLSLIDGFDGILLDITW